MEEWDVKCVGGFVFGSFHTVHVSIILKSIEIIYRLQRKPSWKWLSMCDFIVPCNVCTRDANKAFTNGHPGGFAHGDLSWPLALWKIQHQLLRLGSANASNVSAMSSTLHSFTETVEKALEWGKTEHTHIDLSTVEAILVDHTAKTQQEITKHNTSVPSIHGVSLYRKEKKLCSDAFIRQTKQCTPDCEEEKNNWAD